MTTPGTRGGAQPSQVGLFAFARLRLLVPANSYMSLVSLDRCFYNVSWHLLILMDVEIGCVCSIKGFRGLVTINDHKPPRLPPQEPTLPQPWRPDA